MAISEYRTKAGIRYRAEIWKDQERQASRAGFLTKRDAKAWVRETESALENCELSAPTSMGLIQLTEKYLEDVEDRKRRNTFVSKRSIYRRFIAYIGHDIPVKELSQDQAGAYLKTIKDTAGAKTANRHLRELKTLFNWAITKGHVREHPFRSFETYPEDPYIRYTPPPEDIDKVRLVATGDERDLIDCLYFTAGRLSEILTWTWEKDINFEQRAATLWTRKRRGGSLEPRILAMTEALYSVLWRRWQNRDKELPWVFVNPETKSHFQRNNHFVKFLFARLCAKAGVKVFTAHCIRHHVATRIKDSRKATTRQIQQFLGHKRLSTTEIYLHDLDVDRGILEAFENEDSQKFTHGFTHGRFQK
jgi:site-specific recombinase XerD